VIHYDTFQPLDPLNHSDIITCRLIDFSDATIGNAACTQGGKCSQKSLISFKCSVTSPYKF
jgi:hypothetical protein